MRAIRPYFPPDLFSEEYKLWSFSVYSILLPTVGVSPLSNQSAFLTSAVAEVGFTSRPPYRRGQETLYLFKERLDGP
jgi:hypothetical protein